jgi:hypothetical protein
VVTETLGAAMLNGALIAVGLYVLWRVLPRHAPTNLVAAAIVAGIVSALATVVVRQFA